MIVELKSHSCIVTLEKGERMKTESDLFYKLKVVLQNQGYDVIKKCPEKDGHMYSAPWYIRERKWAWCLVHNRHELELAHEVINQHRSITLYRHTGPNWN